MNSQALTRRGLLRTTGAAVVGIGATGLIAACGDNKKEANQSSNSEIPAGAAPTSTAAAPTMGAPAESGAGTSASGTSSATTFNGVQLPTYVPFSGVTPDYPPQLGADAAFVNYPAKPAQLLTSPPLKGGSVTFLTQAGMTPAVSKNQWWQNINKVLGTSLELDYTPRVTATYLAKFATVIAGNDIPDGVSFAPPMPNIPEILAAKFQDLTPFLSGDNVKKYPYLAAIPTAYWKIGSYNKGIYGIPWSRGPIHRLPLYRADLVTKMGLSADLSNGQDFLNLCKELTDVKQNRWAVGMLPTTDLMNFFMMMCGAPNGWMQQSGKFTYAYETDEAKRALSLVTDFWKGGYVEPDSFTTTQSYLGLAVSGKTVIEGDNLSTWISYTNGVSSIAPVAGVVMDGLTLPKWDGGGKANQYLLAYSGAAGFTAVKKASDSRIEEVLQVLNWMTAPFGTQEYLQQVYGLEGVDYKLQSSNPIRTQQGLTDNFSSMCTDIATSPEAIYCPGKPDDVKRIATYVANNAPTAIADASDGYYSATAASKGQQLVSNVQSLMGDIIQGRRPLSAWDDGIKTWQNQGGNTIRDEYEKALQGQ